MQRKTLNGWAVLENGDFNYDEFFPTEEEARNRALELEEKDKHGYTGAFFSEYKVAKTKILLCAEGVRWWNEKVTP
jgi:hypothetical protein